MHIDNLKEKELLIAHYFSENTKKELAVVAESLGMCQNPRLKELKYRRIGFLKHKYFMLYRVEGNMAIVDNIFHELQDYENKMR